MHSTFPLISLTAPVGSAVVPLAASEAARVMLSCSGSARLNGCEDCMLLPNTSEESIDPRVVTWPYATVAPTATVPS